MKKNNFKRTVAGVMALALSAGNLSVYSDSFLSGYLTASAAEENTEAVDLVAEQETETDETEESKGFKEPFGESGTEEETITEEVQDTDTIEETPENDKILIKVNAEGNGQIAVSDDGSDPIFNEESPIQSAAYNLAVGESIVLKAKSDEGWTFSEWKNLSDGSTYSKDDTITINASEALDLVAVFSYNEKQKAVRTVMLYDCGSNLETEAGMASFNLRQVLKADFGEEVRFVVMTGGSDKWQLESDYLYDPTTGTSPAEISSEYNQIWEAKGINAKENTGKMVLVDGDGLSGDGENAKKSADESMADPETLKSFINYSVENYPADKYDLILWDHGGGPAMGFATDQHTPAENISFSELVDAFSDNAVTKDGGKFDFIDFDACLMGSVDLTLAFADYTDYYIASPETEPGYGQDYTGWLDMLGENPYTDTYTLGKKIVDDFIAFYDTEGSIGYGQNGTLSIIDTKKFVESDLVSALTDLSAIMHNELIQPDSEGEYLFYDELFASNRAIDYGKMDIYLDLGTLMRFMSINTMELKTGNLDGETIDNTNAYKDVAKRVLDVIENPDIIYARGTSNFGTKEADVYRNSDGTLEYGTLGTSGIYLPVFKSGVNTSYINSYFNEIDSVLERIPDDERSSFLRSYIDVMNEYFLTAMVGKATGYIVDCGIDRSEITYDTVKAYWTGEIGKTEKDKMTNKYNWECFKTYIERYSGGEEAVRELLDPIIRQQAQEAVSRDNISVDVVNSSDFKRYIINIDNTKKRTIDNICLKYFAELPVAEEYLSSLNHEFEIAVRKFGGELCLGSGDAWLRVDDDLLDSEYSYGSFFDWYNQPSGSWSVDGFETKWYAVSDADGILHVAQVKLSTNTDQIAVAAAYESEGKQHLVVLIFRDNKLDELALFADDMKSYRKVSASEFTGELELMSVNYVDFLGLMQFIVPMSKSTFTLSPDNIDKIELVYTDIENIGDIEDINGNGSQFRTNIVVRDIYGYETDISEKSETPEKTFTNISVAHIADAVYDGTEKKPVVMVGDKVLEEGVDYVFVGVSDDETFTEVGIYNIIIMGQGEYSEAKLMSFEILPAEDFASPEELAKMAKKDYQKKHNTTVTPEIISNENNRITVDLKDKSGKVVDTYEINVKTGIGEDTQGEEVNLPQTGNNSMNNLLASVGALMMIGFGAVAMKLSGIFRRKEDE